MERKPGEFHIKLSIPRLRNHIKGKFPLDCICTR